ncbi:MAG: AMP-binding protein [Gemmataceae bacterium]|nr:AMP-binding protein [Gemmataceae bacterium]
MLWPIRWACWALFRFLLSLRYWVRVDGKPEVFEHPGPYLILPNHPAYSDPPNLLMKLWPAFKMRPMLLETNFTNPVLGFIAWLLRAIKVPDVVAASAEARERAQGSVNAAIEALKAGDSVILWPSGRLMRHGVEHVGGTRAVADILAAVPGVTVVLARTRGLWGSMFSYAPYTTTKLSLGRLVGRGLALWAANLFLFAPRRRVTVTLEPFTRGQRPEPNRDAINKWLDDWFNADTSGGPETPTYVPRHLLAPRTFEFPPRPGGADTDLSKVKLETKQAVAQLIEDKLKRPLAAAENAADTTFMTLGLDSLDVMEVTLQVEQQFGFSGDQIPSTVGELWALAEGLAEKAPPRKPPAGWFAAPSETGPLTIDGDTIPAAILNRAFRQRRDVIAADDLAGGVTYERLLVAAGAMARRFKPLDGANVGLLLPASVACDLAFVGLHLAGKLPVVLNWTTGPANLGHAVKVMGLKRVVTSKAFIDRVQVTVPGAEFVYLEEVRAGIGKLELLRRLLHVRWFPGWAKGRLLEDAATDPQAPAVVLFTSGSEKAPKAVPLTHANILADQRGALDALQLTRENSAIGFLPMFHSFGLTVTGLLPLAVGVRIVHHPDPTDAGGIVRKVAAYKPSLIAATPTFMGFILDRAKPGDLDSLRLVIVGAEKCPADVFDKARRLAPRAEVVEGYGITECSPVVSVNRPGRVKPGTIGEPLPGVDVCVTDLETEEVLPGGRRGMLLVSGPIVFPGYVGHEESPFRELNGKTWYVTGDLAELDPGGAIVFHGRLKRFLKAGGEMISLPALEEPFARKYPPTDAGPRVAVEGVETPAGRRVVLFTTEDVSLRDANALLLAEGFRGVMRLDEVRRVDAIPVLGTGKTDYKVLRGMIEG